MMTHEELIVAVREIARVLTDEIRRPGDNEDRYGALKRAEAMALAALDGTQAGATDAQLASVGFEHQNLTEKYKSDAADAMALYNQEVADHAKLEASLIRLSDNDRQLLRMIVPSVDQRSREPGDAWNEAAAILWLLIDTTDHIAAFRHTGAA